MILQLFIIQFSFALEFFPTVSKNAEFIDHQYFSLSYKESKEGAEWVYYELEKKHLLNPVERASSFIPDPLITTGSAKTQTYRHSGYDRGHLVPARDRAFSKEAILETFYTSNISPQTKELNRGMWKDLETKIRTYVDQKSHNKLVIIAGPIWTSTPTKIQNSITVPKAFFKIIFDGRRVIAFIIPQIPKKELADYQVNIDKIEKLTKLDFFNQLSTQVESALEKNIDKVFLEEVL